MGAPSQAQIQPWSDAVAAVIAKDLAGFDAELSAKTNPSLWALLDGSVDPAVISALSGPSDNVDSATLPENYPNLLAVILGRQKLRDWVTSLSGLVTGAGGGGFASLQAYLNSVAAVVHPLFAELVRAQYGEGSLFNAGAGAITEVFAPNYQSRFADHVYGGVDGALTDLTAAAGNATTADMALWAANNNAVYVGSRYKFGQIVLALSTFGNTTILPLIEYWNGVAWTAVAGLVDNSTGFTKNDTLRFTIPSDWVRSYKDKAGNALGDKTPLYYLRIGRTQVTVATPPVGTCLRIIPAFVPQSAGAATHLGVDQPPLAIARITGVNTLVIEPQVGIDIVRFKAPGLSMRALTPISAALTLTLAYLSQAGVQQSQAQAAFGPPAALDVQAITLFAGDTGARSIPGAGSSVVTTATQGVFEIFAPALRTPAL